MWPRTSELEKIAKDNGRSWTSSNSRNPGSGTCDGSSDSSTKGNEGRVKGMRQKSQMAVISIGDLTSEAVPKLAQFFKAVPGVESVAFNLELQVASVEFEPQQCSVETLQRAVLKAGYKLL